MEMEDPAVKILKRVLVVLVGAVALLALVGVFLPASVHVERSIEIDSPPANVFTLLNGFSRFNDWSPWAGLDPAAEYRYEGPETGVGASMHWTGDESVGTGSQVIVTSEPYSLIETELDFGAQGTARAAWHLEPIDGGTRVTWAMDAEFGWDLVGRYFGLMLDRWVGGDYEKGLAKLKSLAESLPNYDLAGADVAVIPVEPVAVVMVSGETTHEPDDVTAAMATAYGRLEDYMAERNMARAGPPLAIAREWSNQRYVFDAALPYSGGGAAAPSEAVETGDPGPGAVESPGGNFRLADEVHAGVTHGGRAARIVHVGPYESLADSWNRLEAYIAARGLKSAGDPWEAFLSDPADTPEDELVTNIYWPVD